MSRPRPWPWIRVATPGGAVDHLLDLVATTNVRMTLCGIPVERCGPALGDERRLCRSCDGKAWTHGAYPPARWPAARSGR